MIDRKLMEDICKARYIKDTERHRLAVEETMQFVKAFTITGEESNTEKLMETMIYTLDDLTHLLANKRAVEEIQYFINDVMIEERKREHKTDK